MSDRVLDAVAARALDLVEEGNKVGLGTGRAASAFISRLGERVRKGLHVVAVPTSEETARQARDAGITLVDLSEAVELDLTVDGADEVAPSLDLVKGWGGALVRERIVASASRRFVVLVRHDKLVGALGERGRIPVEIVPFARGPAMHRLRALCRAPTLRTDPKSGEPFVTENQNLIIDCALDQPLADARAARDFDDSIRAIAGVVDTGLFLGMAERVLVGHPDGRVEVLGRDAS
jgi:ribose 5-phosphate isomerase A